MMLYAIYVESEALGRTYFTDIDGNKAIWPDRAAAERRIDLPTYVLRTTNGKNWCNDFEKDNGDNWFLDFGEPDVTHESRTQEP